MGKFSKAIASLSIVAILSSLVVTATTAFAAADVPSDHFAYTDVTAYQANGVLQEGNFFPNRNIVRAEVAKVILEAAGAELVAGDNCDELFSDCEVPSWYATYVSTAAAMNILRGTPEGLVMPGANVNRADLMVMLSRLHSWPADVMGSDSYSDVPAGSYYSSAVGAGRDAGVACGYPDGSFRPGSPATRAEAIVMIARSFKAPGVNTPCADVDPVDPVDPEVDAEGDLEVSVSADTPEGATLPSGATAVTMATWDFEAGADDAVINALTVHRYGVSDLPATHQVYLYNGTERLTSGRTVNSTSREVTFNGLNLMVEDGETVSLSLRMDTGTVANVGEVGFEIESAEAVNAGGEVDGDFPLRGDIFDLSTTAAGVVTIEKNGTVADPKVGEDDVEVAKFKITTATEAASLEELGLYFTGNVSSDAIENCELFVSGEDDPIATAAGLNAKDIAVFTFEDPYAIAKGENKAMSAKCDLNTGRAADTIQVYIDETTDVVAIGDIYGFGMTVDLDNNSGYDGTACNAEGGNNYNDCTNSTIEGGDLTISSNGPAAVDIAIAGDDRHLMDFSITSVSDVRFRNLPVKLTASEPAAAAGLLSAADVANFTDIKIVDRDSGETVMGPVDADAFTTALAGNTAITDAADTTGFYLFNDEFEMEAGEELNLALTADVENVAALDGMTIVGTLELGSTYPEVRDINNKVVTNSTTLVPASPIVGKTMTVTTPELTASLAAVPTTDSFVKGSKGVQFLGVSLQCGSASDCELDDLTLSAYIDDEGDHDDFDLGGGDGDGTNVYVNEIVGSVNLEDSEGNIIASESVPTSGTITFSSVDWNIDAGETVVLYVAGDISSSAFKNTNAEDIAFSVATGGITYTDEDGNTRDSVGAVNGSQTTYMTTANGGALDVAVDSGSANENILVAGTADQEVSKFQFSAENESFVIKKLGINNRSAADALTAIGGQDDNVTAIKLSYTNSAGVVATKTGQLTNGTVQFEGLDIFVEKDEDATVSVMATLNNIESGADAGDYIDFNLSFANFEAVTADSGETYSVDKIDADVLAASDLDFGSISYTDGDNLVEIDTEPAVLTTTLGSTATLVFDDAADDNTRSLPVGTILCVDDNDDAACTNENIWVVTSVSYGTLEDTYTLKLIDDNDAADQDYDTNDPILYALPGAGYLTGTDRQYVYKTLPVLTLASDSPSGVRTVSGTDTIFKFNITPDAKDDVVIRQGLEGDDEADVNNVTGALADGEVTETATAGNFIDGTDGVAVLETAGAAAWAFTLETAHTAAAINSHDYVSFWLKYNDVAADSTAPLLTDFDLILDTDNDPAAGTTVVDLETGGVWINGTAATAGQSFSENAWMLVTVSLATALDAHTNVGLALVDTTRVDDDDAIYLDSLVFHNEMLTIDITGNDNLDITPTSPVLCTLKDGNTTVATGYVGTRNDGAGDIASSASVLLVPQDHLTGTDYSTIEVTKGTGKTYSLVCDTQSLVTQTGNDDLLTPSIDYGSSTDGTVTRGDFWWAADEATRTTVFWLGDVGVELNGNALRY